MANCITGRYRCTISKYVQVCLQQVVISSLDPLGAERVESSIAHNKQEYLSRGPFRCAAESVFTCWITQWLLQHTWQIVLLQSLL